MTDKHRQVTAMLKGYASDVQKLRALKSRLEEIESHGSLGAPAFGDELPCHEVSDRVLLLVQRCESLRIRIERVRKRIRKVERLRTRLLERGRYSERHERMRLMLEHVYLAGMDCREFVRMMGWSGGESDELRNDLLDYAVRVMLA